MKRLTAFALVLLVVCAVAALGGCGDSGSDDSTTEPAGGVPSAEQVDGGEATTEGETLAIGGQGVAGPYSLTLTGVSRDTKVPDGQKPAAGNEFLIVSVEFNNSSDEPWGVGPAYFALTDSSGAAYQAFPTGTEDFIFNMPQPIQPQSSAATRIAYEIPQGTTGFTFVWTPSGTALTEPVTVTYAFD